MSKIGDLFVRLGLKKTDFDRGIKDATKSTKTFGDTASKFLGGVAAKFLTVAAAIKVLGDAVKTMATFERANSTLAAVLKTTTQGIKELTDSAKALGRTTEFTATDVTKLQTELARLGFQQQDILAMQSSVLKFASAVGTDLASAAAFAGGALRTFGLTAEDTQDLLDIMADATTKSALNFSKLETSMGIVFPIAKQFGLSVADTTAMLGTLSNVMPDASSAATALRNILLNLADDNGKLASAIGHSAKTFPEIVSAFEELTARGVDLNEVLGMSDKRSASALAAFISNTKALRDLRDAFNDSTGSVNEMYDTMTNNLEGAVRSLKSAWEGLVLSWSQSTGVMKSVVEWMTKMVNKLTDFNEASQTGGAGSKQKQETNDLWQRFKYIGDEQGTEAMRAQFAQWERDANAAYDRAIDNYNNHRSRKNRKAMEEAGKYALGLSDIKGQVMNYDPSAHVNHTLEATTPTGGSSTPELTDEQKKQIQQDKQRIEAIKQYTLEENQALAARYEKNLALLKQYGQDTSSLSDKFAKDLVSNLTIDAKPDDLLESVMSAPERLEKHYNEILEIMQKYNLDASGLREKFNLLMVQADAEEQAEMQAENDALDEWSRTWLEHFAAMNDISLDPLKDELRDFTDATLAEVDRQEAALERAKELAQEFGRAVAHGVSDACEELMDQLFGLKQMNMGSVISALLTPLADMAVKEGEILVAEGIGVEACKKALESLNGYAAITAGAALIAIGSAAKAGLKSLGASAGSATAATATASSGSYGDVEDRTEITIYVRGKLDGSDIVLSGDKTLNKWNR